MCNFYWWIKYFDTNKIDSVFVSHSVTDLALPARIAIKYEAKAHVAAWSKIYKLNSRRLFSDLEFIDYDPSTKNQFGFEIKIEEAKKLLTGVKNGQISIDAHSLGSGYNGDKDKKIIQNLSEINILIACHCFSDPPHSYGDTLFPDFKEWLTCIGQISKVTNYNFYIKAHPNFWASDKLHFRNFLNEFPNIIEVPSNFSNLELFKQGVKVVLTVYGTIAFEAAHEGILVVNASRVAPHMNYSFSKMPSSVEEFQYLIFNLPKILDDWQINKSEVEHFFALHHLRKKNSILFGIRTLEFYEHIGGAGEQFLNPKVFDFWLNTLSLEYRSFVEKKIRSFLNNDDYILL